MKNAQDISYSVAYDIVITGRNSECADMSNPEGHEFGDAYYVTATDEHGYRKTLFLGVNYDRDQAEKLADALNARALSGRFPVRWADWRDSRPQYGSVAFEESGQGAEDAALERADELGE